MKTVTAQLTTAKGPTTAVLVQRFDGSSAFDKTWSEFKAGFGDAADNYWLGNDKISQLTLGGCSELTFVLQV
jgi:Fibrinogen beta and gamma chains, C-terminal globular domain